MLSFAVTLFLRFVAFGNSQSSTYLIFFFLLIVKLIVPVTSLLLASIGM